MRGSGGVSPAEGKCCFRQAKVKSVAIVRFNLNLTIACFNPITPLHKSGQVFPRP
ncbi:hypothetical protein QO005_004198 [Rhizobium paknamense]|uniref:Uncharacterized protein n=1 Tax=Rhizobium paknamense TaxID=1206817 RepID=A0ABU0IHV5_9HYPH|nr:hypothetical protein [Rhizobium paknamense]